jgi:hypothetical protein
MKTPVRKNTGKLTEIILRLDLWLIPVNSTGGSTEGFPEFSRMTNLSAARTLLDDRFELGLKTQRCDGVGRRDEIPV